MKNPYNTTNAKILKVREEGSNCKIFDLRPEKGSFNFKCGQFAQFSLPGFGESPISICSDPREGKYFQICVRKAGRVTGALHELQKGDLVGVRGPYGNNFPVRKGSARNLLIIVGGLGLIPVRPAILEYLNEPDKFKGLQVLYGACSEDDLLFCSSYEKWKKSFDLRLALDKPKKDKRFKQYACDLGMVTDLLDKSEIIEDPVAFLCGPPVMYRFVVKKLKEMGFKDQDIFMSLERRMHCAIGICQHCAIGSKYVCKDGPVFRYDEIKGIPGAI